MTIREDIVAEAHSLIGVRWHHLGRNPEFPGLDCVGLLSEVGVRLGLFSEHIVANYPRLPNGTFLQQFRDFFEVEVGIPSRQPGDILVFTASGEACHCGIYVNVRGVHSIIHGHAGLRKVAIQSLESVEGSSRIGRVTNVFLFPQVK